MIKHDCRCQEPNGEQADLRESPEAEGKGLGMLILGPGSLMCSDILIPKNFELVSYAF